MRCNQSAASTACCRVRAIASGITTSHQPSLHSRNASPARTGSGAAATCTSIGSAPPSAHSNWFLRGWWRAASGVRKPASTICCTRLSSRVSATATPSRSRYSRLSPTCAQTTSPRTRSRHSATTVACMRWRPCRRACSALRRAWACSMASPSRTADRPSPAVAARRIASSTVVTTRRDASSPRLCPPAPSDSTAQARSPASPTRRSSSLWSRAPGSTQVWTSSGRNGGGVIARVRLRGGRPGAWRPAGRAVLHRPPGRPCRTGNGNRPWRRR